jgi:diguanylate cyclase (GGDEF)-like protein
MTPARATLRGRPAQGIARSDARAEAVDVLIVEDELGARIALADAVRALGYPVRAASSGAEALAEYTRRPAAIVVTDWSMPGMTGLELCGALKRLDPQSHVIMITAFHERSRLVEALKAGADEFVAKPLDLDELEARLVAATRAVDSTRTLIRMNVELRRDSEREFRIARTDPLTTVPNRLRMDEDLARAVSDASRYGRRYCVAICDIDHFKRYNDRHGHLAGDAALHRVALALRDGVRASDSVYRFGGEEFLLLFPQQTPEEVAIAVERIRAQVEALGLENGLACEAGALTISAGIAELVGRSKDEWLARADAALYRAKAEGRNRVAIV